ncbi:hypothetical protein ACFXB4_20680 [Streptomyces lavendulae]|uniref:hypothetical protein n=1 Tax=Streptomyces lavendulae TaxID=1914 RepID=UPI0036C42ADF
MNIQPLLDALDIQKTAAPALAGDHRAQIEELQGRSRAETRLERLAITRNTVTALADRFPVGTSPPETPEHLDYPRILAAFNEVTGPLGPVMSAKPSATNCWRRTSRRPAPS